MWFKLCMESIKVVEDVNCFRKMFDRGVNMSKEGVQVLMKHVRDLA